MNLKVAFFTEMGFVGKVPRDHTNMRTEFAWMVALNADHHHLTAVPEENYDLAMVILPKNKPIPRDIKNIRNKCKVVAFIQEGPADYFQDYEIADQINYFNYFASNPVFAHNEIDAAYYEGLTQNEHVHVLPSLMIPEVLKDVHLEIKENRKDTIIGGNFVKWYGGFDSYIAARNVDHPIWAPSMGRKKMYEEGIVKHIPYVDWKAWMVELSKFKVGVHLMKTFAAGTFALNCSFLGIPCVGYKGLDTQEGLHPHTSVEVNDVGDAAYLVKKLYDYEGFYTMCSESTSQAFLTWPDEKDIQSIVIDAYDQWIK